MEVYLSCFCLFQRLSLFEFVFVFILFFFWREVFLIGWENELTVLE